MTATLGTALVSSATLHVERYGIPHTEDVALIDDTSLDVGSSQALTVGTLSLAGTIVRVGDFGGQTRLAWVGGAGAWDITLLPRPYHDDGGIMLSVVLADLERDAATAAGRPSLGTALEVPDVRLDVAGSWIRPAAAGRSLLDALAAAAGQLRGSWWIAPDGSTHLGPRPPSSVSLSDLTIDPFDAALLRAVVRSATDDIGPLLPGATLTAPGLPVPLYVAALVVHVDGLDVAAELWGEASEAEAFARCVRAVMDPALAYLGAQPYSVTSVAGDGRVAVAAPPGAPFPDAPLLGHAPGIPGAVFTLAPGADVLVGCVGGNPGAPACMAYPAGVLPVDIVFDASGTVSVGGMNGNPPAVAGPLQLWAIAVVNAIALLGGSCPSLSASVAATKARVV